MTSIVSFILNHPKKVLALIGITTYFFAISLINLNYNFTIEQLFAKNKKESDIYFEFQKEFSREDNVFLLVHKLPNNSKSSCVMINVKNIYKSFNQTTVLNNISASFEKAKTNLVIGQSGSGKTVFIKCMLGLINIDKGKIQFENSILDKMNSKERIKLRQEIGMVFQGSALFDSMNVIDNITFPMKMFTNKSNEEILSRANDVIKRVNLENSNYKMPNEISGGMKKRVAIARAIVMNPKYLFCDEPNSGLDPKTAIIIDNLIQEITKEYNITTIINTHDMNSVMEIGEKIIFLKNGQKEWEGNNTEIFKSENKSLNEFVYSSELFKKVKKIYNN